MLMFTRVICVQWVEALAMTVLICGNLILLKIGEKHLEMVESYLATLPKNLSSSVIHSRKLAFMAENGIPQLGKPRIGVFADRVKPDPLHCEINAWQHILDLLYSELVRRHAFEKFIATLSAPIGVISTANSPDLK